MHPFVRKTMYNRTVPRQFLPNYQFPSQREPMSEAKLQKDGGVATRDQPETAGRESAFDLLTLTAYRLKPVTLKIVPAPIDRDWMDWHQNGANRCLPLRVANQAGWFILNDCDLEATWTGKPQIGSLQVKYAKGSESKFIRNIFGHGILTWHIPYLFRTPPGYNLLVRGPTNWIKDGACPLDGLVETDWAVATFTMNWKLTRPHLKVKFRAGEPICMLIPQRRGETGSFQPEVRNIESAPELQQGHRKWAESRSQLIAQKKAMARENKLGGKGVVASWQPDYFRGSAPGGEKAPEHQVNLQIRPFEEIEPALATPTDTAQETSVRQDAPPHAPSSWQRLKRLLQRD